jgi:hypothetical protein
VGEGTGTKLSGENSAPLERSAASPWSHDRVGADRDRLDQAGSLFLTLLTLVLTGQQLRHAR